jgi:hypothetical protein
MEKYFTPPRVTSRWHQHLSLKFHSNWEGNKEDVGALGTTHCTSGDDQLEKALERTQT